MNILQHTPGPWAIAAPNPSIGFVVYSMGRVVAGVSAVLDAQDAHANAKLIAAAPELLDALDCLVDAVVNRAPADHLEGYLRTAERAIAKATWTAA